MEFIDTTTPSSPEQLYQTYAGDRKNQRSQDWATMYYQNAYNTALMNYQNEYNSPLQQMLRYQEAGISPWMVAQNVDAGNMSSSHASAAPKGNFQAPTSVQRQAAAVQTLQGLNQVMQSAGQMYDMIKYGYPTHQQQLENLGIQGNILQQQLSKYQSEADWSLYWNYGEGFGPNSLYVQDSPRARYMQYSSEEKAAHIRQLSSLVDSLYPSQVAANEARAALAAYQQEILAGKNDAILQLDTGYPMLDSWLKVILMMLSNTNLGVMIKP